MRRAELIRAASALAALETAWRELWTKCPQATPFQSPEWLLPWWETFAPGELASVAVSDAGRLVALAPLYLEVGAQGRRLLPIGISLSDYTDMLVDPDEPETRDELLASLGDVEGWSMLSFDDVPEWSGLSAPDDAASHSTPVLAIGSRRWDEHVPARKRRQWRRACRAAQGRGGYEIVAAQDTDAFLTDLFALHEARWRTRGEPGVLGDSRVRAFHRLAAPRLAEQGLARLYRVRIGGDLAGAYYGFHHGHRAYAYIGGFDPRFEAESPGAILIGHALECAFLEGAREFHFLRGDERYKFDWGAEPRWNRRVTIRNEAHAPA